jgi:hypothetical protein
MSSTSIADLRYLNPDSRKERWQVQIILEELGTSPEVIAWFFEQLQHQQRAYVTLQQQLRETESRLPEE